MLHNISPFLIFEVLNALLSYITHSCNPHVHILLFLMPSDWQKKISNFDPENIISCSGLQYIRVSTTELLQKFPNFNLSLIFKLTSNFSYQNTL